jgi:hypothetical protein
MKNYPKNLDQFSDQEIDTFAERMWQKLNAQRNWSQQENLISSEVPAPLSGVISYQQDNLTLIRSAKRT